MSITNFPYGVSSFGVPLIGSSRVLTTGRVFFVHSGTGVDASGRGTDKDRPFASIDYAVGKCAANKKDIIIAMPGHVETVVAAAGLDLDVAGIHLIGLGRGADRPTINFTTATTADMDVDAANIEMENFLFTGGIDALAAPIDVNAADFCLHDCEWRDVTGQATDVILADASADRLHIYNHFHNGAAAAGGDTAVALVGMDNPHIHNFVIIGNFALGAIQCRTTAVVDLNVHDGYIWTKNAADLAMKDLITGSTGKVGPNITVMLTDNAANITEAFTGATFQYFQDLQIINLAGESSMLSNITASTDA